MKLCTACRRHVREEACPFCGGTDLQVTTPGSGNTAGVSRARLIAGAAALAASSGVLVLQACSAGTGEPGPAQDGGQEDATPLPLYGGPPSDAGLKDVVNTPDAAYGGPPLDSGVAPAYGAPAYGAAPTP